MEKTNSKWSPRTWGFVALSVVVMAIISFVYFYPDVVEGNVLQQADMRQGIANGQEGAAFTQATGEVTRWTNSLFGGMPNFQISPSYPSSSLFNWINTVFGLGLPAPANLLVMMMLGFFILLLAMEMRWYVALLGAIAYGFSSYFIIIIGAGHIWKFVTLAYVPPTIAGLVLCYRGRYLLGGALAALFGMMQIASNHVQMTYYFMFVILGFVIVYAIDAYRNKEMRRWLVATGTLVVSAVLAVAANAPSLYNTYEYSKQTIRGGHSELAAPAGQTTSTDAGLDRDYITAYSYAPSETFTLVIPNVKGGATNRPEKGSSKYMSLAELPDAENAPQESGLMINYLSQYFGDPEGTNGPVYVGALICALFLLGCIIVKGPIKWALIVLTIFSILLAWGRHFMGLTDFMIDYMPMYSKFRTVESILVIAEFTMPLLAAMALQQIFSTPIEEAAEKYAKPLLISFGFTAFICMIAMVWPSIFGEAVTDADRDMWIRISDAYAAQGYDRQSMQALSLSSPVVYDTVTTLRYGMVKADALRSLMFVLVGFVLLWFYLKRRVSLAVAATGAVVVVLLDLFVVNKRYLSHESFTEASLQSDMVIPPTSADIKILADTAQNYRVLDIQRFQSADPSYYHKSIGGYHAAKLTSYQDIIERQLIPYLSHLQTMDDLVGNPVVNMLNTRYIIVDPNADPIVNPNALGNAWFVDTLTYVATPDQVMNTLTTLNTATSAVARDDMKAILGEATPKQLGDTIFETSYAPNRLTYHAQTAKGGVAVFSEVYFPWGWEVTIDGKPVDMARVNYILRAIRIPAGSHTIEMVFNPRSLHTTDTMATVAVIVIYLMVLAAVVIPVIRRKKEDKTTDEAKTEGAN